MNPGIAEYIEIKKIPVLILRENTRYIAVKKKDKWILARCDIHGEPVPETTHFSVTEDRFRKEYSMEAPGIYIKNLVAKEFEAIQAKDAVCLDVSGHLISADKGDFIGVEIPIKISEREYADHYIAIGFGK